MDSDPELMLLTRILRARLAQKSIIDCHILDRKIFAAPRWADEHVGRYVGFFTRRPAGNICFFVFLRSDPEKSFDYVFGYYVNVKFFHIPKSELNQFRYQAKEGTKLSLQMVQTDAHLVFHSSVLIQMIVFTLGMNLVNDYKKYRLLKSGGSDLFLCFNPSIPLPNCDPENPTPEAKQIVRNIESRGVEMQLFRCSDPTPIEPTVDLIVIIYNGHLVFGIHYKRVRLLNILLPHVVQFRHQTQVNELKSAINLAFGDYKLLGIVASRLYSTANECCNSAIAMKACALAIPHPFVSIRDCELRAVLEESHLDQPLQPTPQSIATPASQPIATSGSQAGASGSQVAVISSSQSTLLLSQRTTISTISSFSSIPTTDAETSQPEDIPTIEDVVRTQEEYGMASFNCGDPEPPEEPISFPEVSSQDTVVMDEEEIRLRIESHRRARDILALPFPIHNGIHAESDPDGLFLHSNTLFHGQLYLLTETMIGFTTAALCCPTSLHHFAVDLHDHKRTGARFLVVPVLLSRNSDALIVVDRENEEWGYMCPDNLAWRYPRLFEEIKEKVKQSTSLLANFEGLAINLTSYYHTAYPRVHLLMALFHLSKLFRYASVLPRKVIYRETDFRGYCHEICRELAVANAVYNLENGLIKRNTFLADGAYISHASPVQYERATVNEDQCEFCLKRGSKNLGSHKSMKHGGYGRRNRECRRWRESLRK